MKRFLIFHLLLMFFGILQIIAGVLQVISFGILRFTFPDVETAYDLTEDLT